MIILDISSEEFDMQASSPEKDEIIDDLSQESTSESFDNYELPNDNEDTYNSKDGLEIWHRHRTTLQRRTVAENIYRLKKGFTSQALSYSDTPAMAFSNFFTNSMLNIIVDCTNISIEDAGLQYDYITMNDFNKFIGACLLIGLMKGKNVNIREFWSEKYGQKMIIESIGIRKFETITRFIRFDRRSTRNRQDRLAPVRIVWDMLIERCKKLYNPSEQVTVDEQLVIFKGRCPFKVYIPNKPGKYGMKIWALCDASNAYLYNAKVYLGKETVLPEKNQGENIVKTLCIPIYKSGRNITMDNFFTNLSLARFLLTQKLTIVGTVRKNKTFLTLEF